MAGLFSVKLKKMSSSGQLFLMHSIANRPISSAVALDPFLFMAGSLGTGRVGTRLTVWKT